jgi:DNA-binding response OmpR family regulator
MFAAIHPAQPSDALLSTVAAAGFETTEVDDAAAVLEHEPEGGWAVLVVELGKGRAAALSLARRVRDDGGPPVLLAVPRADVPHLETGSYDDFVVSPIDPDELAVRLRRLTGTTGQATTTEIVRFKDLELNLATYQARLGAVPLDLTYMEYELLRFFATHPARVWSREQLLSRVWGYDYYGGARTVDVHVRRLRAKLGEERASWIATVRSVGYRFG